VNVEFKVLANYTAAFGGLIFFTTTPSCEEKNKESHVGKVSEQKHGLKARMLDYCNDAIFIHDFNGNFTFINSTAYEKLGCSREELMDMNLADFTSAQNPEIVEQNMRRLIDKGQIQYQGEYNCKNGDVIKVDVKSQVMEIGNKKMILTVARDITELEELRTEHKKNSENTAQPNNDNAVKEQVSEAESPCVDQVNKQVVAGGANEINDKLVKWLSVLDQSRNEIALASKMSSFLQSCINMQEANRVITQFLPLLFPTVDGALYLLDSSAETYELLSSWGNNLESDDSFTPDACIAVRRRTAHHVKCGENEDYCSHFAKGINRGYMDIPLTSQGKILGILHLEGKDEVAESDTGNTLTGMAKNLAMIVAGQLAFAVSNIRLQEAVREQTIRDSLTGLYNRRYMEQALDKEIRHAVRSNSTVGMITLDLDSFGKFNEIHGYKSGNLVMRELADFLRSNSHSGDIVCRGNGDEFAILYPQISSDMLKQKAEGIREGLTYFNRRHQELYKEPLTLSLGVAIFPEDGKTPEQIIKLSEIALNRAAQDGGNRIVLAESSAVI
jgi:diguanylate cyclase (GGDEF)-like protein/PAS domain S-box-containing protein